MACSATPKKNEEGMRRAARAERVGMAEMAEKAQLQQLHTDRSKKTFLGRGTCDPELVQSMHSIPI